MKQLFIMGMLFFAVVGISQNTPKLEAIGGLVKATYYHENGQIAQEGMFKDGKLSGKWVAYHADGTKKSIGEYVDGMKTGKWFFWNGSNLSEVDYNNSRIADIKTWKQESLVQNN